MIAVEDMSTWYWILGCWDVWIVMDCVQGDGFVLACAFVANTGSIWGPRRNVCCTYSPLCKLMFVLGVCCSTFR